MKSRHLLLSLLWVPVLTCRMGAQVIEVKRDEGGNRILGLYQLF